MIIPIITIGLCVAAIFFMSSADKKNKNKNSNSGQLVSAQDFINVKDIVDYVLYTKDNYCISYIRLQPPMSSLWSHSEKKGKTANLVSEISKDRDPWTLTAVSRPMDITQLINQYRQLRDETDNPIRKRLLKLEMNELQNRVVGGEAIERQFYVKIWAPLKDGVELDLLDRARKIISYYESVGISGEVLKKPDIIRFCNLFHNPAYVNTDDVNADMSIPIILDMEEI